MRVRLLARAKRDLGQTFEYIAIDNPDAARRVTGRIQDRALSLAQFPEQGSPSGMVRMLVVSGTPYLFSYRIVGDEIRILRVFHGRQHRP